MQNNLKNNLKNTFKVAALFLIVIFAITLYKAVLPNTSSINNNLSASSTPVIARIAPDKLIINNNLFNLELADTSEKQAQGLSGRAALATSTGMLFIFSQPGRWGFWMKEMRFPLDIIWFDANFKPVYVLENLSPSTYPRTFYPSQAAKYVLEIKAGEWHQALLSTN